MQLGSIAMMKETIPKTNIYEWKTKAEEFIDGNVHAKVDVVELIYFVSSAEILLQRSITGMCDM